MSTNQVVILILSVFLIIAVILNIIVDIYFIGWAIYLSWICTLIMFSFSIILFIGLCKRIPQKTYNSLKYTLIAIDILSLLIMIIFIANGLLNWAKIVSILVITPLIIFIHLYTKELSNISDMNSPVDAAYQVPMTETNQSP